jgi:glyoxylase-like metal-dependent hydrolase (beta-lactamase superfamily II)
MAHPADKAVITGEAPYSVRGGLLKPLFWILFRLTDTPGVEVTRELTDGEKYSVLRVIHTPGHTSGHLSFIDEERSILYTGDAIASRRKKLNLTPNIFNDHPNEIRKSALKLAELEFETLLPSHGDPIYSNASEFLRNSSLMKKLTSVS